jgi:hypothetical protein
MSANHILYVIMFHLVVLGIYRIPQSQGMQVELQPLLVLHPFDPSSITVASASLLPDLSLESGHLLAFSEGFTGSWYGQLSEELVPRSVRHPELAAAFTSFHHTPIMFTHPKVVCFRQEKSVIKGSWSHLRLRIGSVKKLGHVIAVGSVPTGESLVLLPVARWSLQGRCLEAVCYAALKSLLPPLVRFSMICVAVRVHPLILQPACQELFYM